MLSYINIRSKEISMKSFVKFAMVIVVVSMMSISCTTMQSVQNIETEGYFSSQVEKNLDGSPSYEFQAVRRTVKPGFIVVEQKLMPNVVKTGYVADELSDEEYQCLALMRYRKHEVFHGLVR